MPANNKTTNIDLNQWQTNEYPKRMILIWITPRLMQNLVIMKLGLQILKVTQVTKAF